MVTEVKPKDWTCSWSMMGVYLVDVGRVGSPHGRETGRLTFAPEDEDKARLIAAAPVIRDALKELREAVKAYGAIGHEGSRLLEAMSDAEEALAKAEIRGWRQ